MIRTIATQAIKKRDKVVKGKCSFGRSMESPTISVAANTFINWYQLVNFGTSFIAAKNAATDKIEVIRGKPKTKQMRAARLKKAAKVVPG